MYVRWIEESVWKFLVIYATLELPASKEHKVQAAQALCNNC
jgi:hypothetical protein